ncbi:MAG TPA: hypothetical protein VFT31_17495 [Kribbella sp.]|nr:hypothetical protein [Kribbella sp.]
MTAPLPSVLTVNVVHAVFRGPTRYTAIDKRSVDGPVEVDELHRPGTITAGDAVGVVHRPDHGVTIGDVAAGPTAEQARRLLETDLGLAEDLRRLALRRSRESI